MVLTGRPEQWSSGEEMHVEVRDRLAAIGAVVDDEAEAFGGGVDAELGGDGTCGEEEVAEEFLVFGGGFADAGDGLFGNDEDVSGGLRIDVFKGEAELVFVDDIGRDFAVDDLLENAHGLKEERCNRPGVNG